MSEEVTGLRFGRLLVLEDKIRRYTTGGHSIRVLKCKEKIFGKEQLNFLEVKIWP